MNQEELKTALGQLLLDLRGNWAYEYYDRLKKARELCGLIEDDTSSIEDHIELEMERSGCDIDGRIFRDGQLYGYQSPEGSTEQVKEWLRCNLTHPEYCPVLYP